MLVSSGSWAAPYSRAARPRGTCSCRRRQQPSIGTKQIRVSEALHVRIQSENRADETLGEALERLVDNYTLEDFADDAVPASDEWDTRELEASPEESDRRNRGEPEDQLP